MPERNYEHPVALNLLGKPKFCGVAADIPVVVKHESKRGHLLQIKV
jgi:hypothetical protein